MDYLKSEIEILLYFLKQKEKMFSFVLRHSPEGTLQGKHKTSGRYSYVHCVRKDLGGSCQKNRSDNGRSRKNYYYKRTGITRDEEMIKALANKEYARRMLELIRYNLHVLENAKVSLKSMRPSDVYSSMKTIYRTLPQEWYDEMNRLDRALTEHTAWAEEPYEMSSYKPEGRSIETSRRTFVRSRAELQIIEKMFERHLVPRYEQVLRIGKYELAPDFTFKGSNGREFYWEYCGMMDDPAYLDRFLWRRKLYEGAGISEWNDMIYTFGTGDHFNVNEVIHVIEDKIIPRVVGR